VFSRQRRDLQGRQRRCDPCFQGTTTTQPRREQSRRADFRSSRKTDGNCTNDKALTIPLFAKPTTPVSLRRIDPIGFPCPSQALSEFPGPTETTPKSSSVGQLASLSGERAPGNSPEREVPRPQHSPKDTGKERLKAGEGTSRWATSGPKPEET
jgi:hypothetical protein